MKEYKVIFVEKEGIIDISSSRLEEELNHHAAQGWRLVSVTRTMSSGTTYSFHFFMERDK